MCDPVQAGNEPQRQREQHPASAGDACPKPPVDLEQWVDFIVASVAHGSSNTGHQKFGDCLIQRYFVTLPERYKEDKVASLYFDNILCTVASAIRGFSVVQEQSETHNESLKGRADAFMARAERLERLSPFSKNDVWGKLISGVAGIGITASLSDKIKSLGAKESLPTTFVYILALIVFITISMLLLFFLIVWIRKRHAEHLERQHPLHLVEHRRTTSREDYRTVLRQFLPIAHEVAQRYYPDPNERDWTPADLERIIERHLVFYPARGVSQD
jgi:hypothetical protein